MTDCMYVDYHCSKMKAKCYHTTLQILKVEENIFIVNVYKLKPGGV